MFGARWCTERFFAAENTTTFQSGSAFLPLKIRAINIGRRNFFQHVGGGVYFCVGIVLTLTSRRAELDYLRIVCNSHAFKVKR